MTINEQIAKDLINERTRTHQATRRPAHPRTARVLRRWARRLDAVE